MASNGTSRRRLMTTLAFRTRISHRALLEAVQRERGHAQLSDTLREAVVEYLHRHVGRLVAAGVLEESGEDAADDRADVLHESTLTQSA